MANDRYEQLRAGHEQRLAVVGAGPVGLALALWAARELPTADVTVFDARPLEFDVAGDPRTLALSLGSVDLLRMLGAWPIQPSQPILGVHVSQQGSLPLEALTWLGEPEVTLHAREQGVDMLGAVVAYGTLVARLQQTWQTAVDADPKRLHNRFGTRVQAVKSLEGRAEVDAGIAEAFALAVVAEGGVFADQPARRFPAGLSHDYRQTAWVGTVALAQPHQGMAYERFTREGPAALLPLPANDEAAHRAALVWCVDAAHDPVRELTPAQRLVVLNTLFPPAVGELTALSPLKDFPLGLSAQTTLVQGRSVHIGNAAQTLHPVAGQGLNLGLRDAYELVQALARAGHDIPQALRRLELRRAPDRWSMIAATDFLARSFTWQFPGVGTARGLGMAAFQRLGPVKSLLARRMMYGWR